MSRSINFSSEEIYAMLTCLDGMKGLVSGNDVEYKSQEQQKEAWEYITYVVNSVGSGTTRDWRNVKNKWIDLKYRTKKKISLLKTECSKDGIPRKIKLTDIDSRVLQIITDKSAEEIESFSNSISEQQIQDRLNLIKAVTLAREERSPSMEDQPSKILIERPGSSRKRPLFNENGERIQGSCDNPQRTQSSLFEGRKSGGTSLFPSQKFLKYVADKTSSERVRRHRLRLRQQSEDNTECFIETQKQSLETLQRIELNSQKRIKQEETVIKNQEKIINQLDSVVTLMSDFNGLMENLNDGINVLTQVIAAKNGIEISETE